MAQYIKNANIFGRVGSGIGKGLAQQLPQEIERGRLASGLQNLEGQQGLTPFQQFSRLAAIPGITPQMIESGAGLLRQQGIAEGFQNQTRRNQEQNNPFNQTPMQKESGLRPDQPSSITTTQPIKATVENYIPKSREQLVERAGELYNQNRQLYPTPNDALQAAALEDKQNMDISNALQNRRNLEQDVQSKTENELKKEIGNYNAQIPGKVFSRLENEALDAVKSGLLTEKEASKKFGKKADEISRDFSNIRSWGDLGILTKNPKDLIGSIKTVQRNAKENGYQKEAADALISENGFTPQFAYANMYPVSDIKSLNEEIKSLPNIKPEITKAAGVPGLAGVGVSRPKNEKSKELTIQAAPKLVKAMGLEGSPLSIGYELDKKGYDSEAWKQYLIDHLDDLNLSKNQIDELQKSKPTFFGWLNDWWLRSFSGVK